MSKVKKEETVKEDNIYTVQSWQRFSDKQETILDEQRNVRYDYELLETSDGKWQYLEKVTTEPGENDPKDLDKGKDRLVTPIDNEQLMIYQAEPWYRHIIFSGDKFIWRVFELQGGTWSNVTAAYLIKHPEYNQ